FAGPITGDAVALTNAGWSFSVEALRRELGLARLLVLNDFAALAWSLPFLASDELRHIGRAAGVAPGEPGKAPEPGATLAVLGPGTGIGMSGLVPTPSGGWAAISGEGGHATLAPADEREADILALTRRHHTLGTIVHPVSVPGQY